MPAPTIPLHHRILLAATAALMTTALGAYAISRTRAPKRPVPEASTIALPVEPPSPIEPIVLPARIIPALDTPPEMPVLPVPPAPKVSAAFMSAVSDGDLPTMQRLYDKGMPLDGTLQAAAATGKRPIVSWLLDHGADVHEGEGEAEAPLLLADARPEIVKLLLARGAAEPDIETAASAGAPNTVTRLIAKHAVVNPKDGASLLYATISSSAPLQNKRAVLEKLLAAGADPNPGTEPSPMSAAVGSCEEIDEAQVQQRSARPACFVLIQMLGARGARVTSGDLQAALGKPAVLDVLLAQHLEPNATAVALTQMSSEQMPDIKKILTKGVAWSWHDGEDDAVAPLLDAIDRQETGLVRAMLEAGAPPDKHFKDGRSALSLALEKGTPGDAPRIVELLLEHSANVNRRLPDGRTPLFAAAESGDLRIINVMLDHGARVNEIVLDATALDAAESAGHIPAARVLHARGGRRAPSSDNDQKQPKGT
jgi:ankyrin repeat protein